MTIYRPELTAINKALPMNITNPKHLVPGGTNFESSGAAILGLQDKIGSEAVVRSGTFEQAMLSAMDKISAAQNYSENLVQAAITEPGTVDAHDITIAQQKAELSLEIARTVLNRLVQGWKDVINVR